MDLEQYMIPCLSKTIFGLECLGCGFQRALLLLTEGEFVAAFQMYPAIYTTLLFIGLLGLQFADRHHNYQKYIVGMAIIEGLVMVVGYFFK